MTPASALCDNANTGRHLGDRCLGQTCTRMVAHAVRIAGETGCMHLRMRTHTAHTRAHAMYSHALLTNARTYTRARTRARTRHCVATMHGLGHKRKQARAHTRPRPHHTHAHTHTHTHPHMLTHACTHCARIRPSTRKHTHRTPARQGRRALTISGRRRSATRRRSTWACGHTRSCTHRAWRHRSYLSRPRRSRWHLGRTRSP